MIIVHTCTMIIVHACTMIIVRACTMIIGYTRTTIIAHACTMIIVHASTRIIIHACTMIIVHACTMIIGHVSCPIGLMFDAIQSACPGGEVPWERTGIFARLPTVGLVGGGTVDGCLGTIPSRGMVKVS